MIYSIQKEILKKARKTRAYLNQPSCSFAIWEVQEAAKHLWPNLSDTFLKKIETKVTDLDAEIYRKASASSFVFDELPGFSDL